MNFNQMVFRLFKANAKKYLLYFLCSSFAVTVSIMYSTVYTNKEFMNPSQISSISSMFIAPTLVLGIFAAFFIVYAHNSYIKFRRNEFGLFMVLGMTNKNILRMILLENGLIAIFSILIGVIVGTLFSPLFYFLITNILDIEGIPFKLTLKSYLYTILFFSAIYVIVILNCIITTSKLNVTHMLKESRKKDKNVLNKPILSLAGLALLGISITYVFHKAGTKKSTVLIIIFMLCLLGCYLFLSNLDWLISKLLYFSKVRYTKNLLFVTSLRYSFGQTKKILFLVTILISITIFFSGIAFAFISQSEELTVAYNPHDLAYIEILGKNKISNELRDGIIKTSKTPLVSTKTLEIILRPPYTIISDENLSIISGNNFHVNKGQFISLFQIVKEDGYAHKLDEIKKIEVEGTGGNKTYTSQAMVSEVIFNNVPILLSTHYIILNHNDYLQVKGKQNSKFIGKVWLFDFKNWHSTKGVAEDLDKCLYKINNDNSQKIYNNSKDDANMFRLVSRIGEFTQRKQSGAFNLFLFSFIGALFFISSGIIMHFKLMSEFDREKEKYKKLNKIGTTYKQVEKMAAKELKILFFLPYFLGFLLATFFSSYLTVTNVATSIMYILATAGIYFMFQLIFYLIYSKLYIRKVISLS